jgi:hypothetical protein
MSLIEEALRKQETEGGKKKSPALSATLQSAPAAQQQPEHAAAPKPAQSVLSANGLRLAVLGVIVITLAMVGISFLSAPKPSVPVSSPAAVAAAHTGAVPVRVVATNMAVASNRAVVASAKPDSSNDTTSVAAATFVRPAAEWPKLAPKGQLKVNGKIAVIFVDGSILQAGATAPSGVTLLDADAGTVRLKYQNETRVYQYNGSFTPVSATDDAK